MGVFRLARVVAMLGLGAFGGAWVERQLHADRCLDRGGAVQGGVCVGVSPT